MVFKPKMQIRNTSAKHLNILKKNESSVGLLFAKYYISCISKYIKQNIALLTRSVKHVRRLDADSYSTGSLLNTACIFVGDDA